MPTYDIDRLRDIRTFPSLVKYLRDELEWPIESTADFDELTFEYEPEELGIDPKTAAKIQEIKQLRPLTTGQPWGIFFVKFEPKRLPVVALRRILGQLVFRKRASANAAERQSWNKHDLLFISNYGEGDDRQITFAHFTENEQAGDLPTLKVLGWDGGDTPLHIDHVQHELTEKLKWPDDTADLPTWRKRWASAFTLRHREVVTTSQQLALRLAELARDIRKKANSALAVENDKGPLTRLMKAFQASLIHDLDADDFADMYAQTIAYGLLSARVSRPAGLVADNVADMVPVTNPFLKELMETFLHLGGRRRNGRNGSGIDFDELGINDVVELLRDANMEAVLRDFGNRNPQEDPVIHFYELFLKEYDARKRMQRGVFYTPRPVVSYIVRSVHELLQSEFGLADGLADTTTWGEMLKKHKDLKLPTYKVQKPNSPDLIDQPIDPASPFVVILDPAVGTATFHVEVIDLIHKTMVAKWKKQGHTEMFDIPKLWNDYVPKHLLPRLFGYELMMAPYAIAHMKIGLKLFETGYRFASGERAHIYLTNALEPPQDFSDTFEQMAPALAHEAKAVNNVKRQQRFTVVIGNPPYSYMSANLSAASRTLVEPFRSIEGVRIVERGALVLERALQDDYVKFFALSFQILESAGAGLFGMISNAAYLSSPQLRGVRAYVCKNFSRLLALDLHGDIKRGAIDDQNVFEIRTGVAIALLQRGGRHRDSFVGAVADLSGPREFKEKAMLRSTLPTDCKAPVCPEPCQYLFTTVSAAAGPYSLWPSVAEAFPLTSVGIKTNRDHLVIDFDDFNIDRRLQILIDPKRTTAEVKTELGVSDNAQWTVEEGRRECRRDYSKSNFRPLAYRPFDDRRIYYHPSVVFNPRPAVMSPMIAGDNWAFLTNRRIRTDEHAHFFVVDKICMAEMLSSADNCNVYPLWLGEQNTLHKGLRQANLAQSFYDLLAPVGVTTETSPSVIFSYVYAAVHSPTYRATYAEMLKRDYPRIPLPGGPKLFTDLADIGRKLVASHLLKTPVPATANCAYTGSARPFVESVQRHTNGTVWLDKNQTCGFAGVPEAVWNFHIGGYQVCEKWLKDRKGRKLSKDDIAHYQKIVVAISETIRLMKEIDETIEKHGGWPGAFVTTPAAK